MVSNDYVATLCDMAAVDVDVLCFQQKAKWNGDESLVEFRLDHPIAGHLFLVEQLSASRGTFAHGDANSHSSAYSRITMG